MGAQGARAPNPNPARSWELPKSEEKIVVLGWVGGGPVRPITNHYGEWPGRKQFVIHQFCGALSARKRIVMDRRTVIIACELQRGLGLFMQDAFLNNFFPVHNEKN